MTAAVLLLVHMALAGRRCNGDRRPPIQPRAVNGIVLTGTVRDGSGRVVPGASVILRLASGVERQVTTAPDGGFSITRPNGGEVVLIVRAGGFAESRQTLAADTAPAIEVVLAPASVSETVTVTATRNEQRTGDLPASISVISREEIRQSPAVVADDLLRQIPTFSLFRRTSSLSSHPTAQGVSLRGIGPSGVSRTLVLLDGVPFNDPFGGWVYWTRVPLDGARAHRSRGQLELESLRQLRDGRGDQHDDEPAARADGGAASRSTATATARRSISRPATSGARSGSSSTAARSAPTAIRSSRRAERGAVDNNASVDFRNVNVEAGVRPERPRPGQFFRAGYFRENRDNGKASTIDRTEEANDTRWTSISGGVRRAAAGREHCCRRACSATSRRSAATSWRCRRRRRRAASAG